MADGFGVKRFAVMYNDFEFDLIGPPDEPAGYRVNGQQLFYASTGEPGA